MTMRVVYLKDHDGHKANKDYFIERTLGRRLCSSGVTVPYSTHMENLKRAKDEAAEKKARKEAEEKAKAEEEAKKEAEEKAEAEKLLKEKEKKERETADSKPAKTRSKAIKK